MKDWLKILITLACLFIISFLTFEIISLQNKNPEKDENLRLANNDPVISLLMEKINKTSELRLGSINPDIIDNDRIVKHLMLTLSKNDYKEKTYKNKKITCEINKNIYFTSDKPCTVKIISNKVLDTKFHELFDTDRELKYNNFEYQGLNCKNDNKNYYCLPYKYTKTIKDYSLIDSAYSKNDEIYIYEYYLNIDFKNTKNCSNFFEEKICQDYQHNQDKINKLDDEIIKKYGVLYKHTFKLKEEKYYWKNTTIEE